MASIDQLILQGVNPFDPVTFYTGDFWQEKQDRALTVDSIHQAAIAEIEGAIAMVGQDHHPRTLLLTGDSGSGKSYLLARLKQKLNDTAFFAYINPWPDSHYIWRHVLRQTVDSLMHVPEGKKQTQLLLWLQGLSTFKNRSLLKKILGEKKLFISKLRNIYSTGIYNAKEFFGVLYHLVDPELRAVACDWLRGDDLDDDDLKALGVKHTIDTEEAAKNILSNFGRIAADTQPIVLCFDQLDNIPKSPEGFLDLQALFNINSSLHSQYPHNFAILISIITSTWREHRDLVNRADGARLNAELFLKSITLDEAESIWKSRLHPLHKQANPEPPSSIYPLKRQALAVENERGKINPRTALMKGRQLFQEYKEMLLAGDRPDDEQTPTEAISREDKPQEVIERKDDLQAAFQLVWHEEFKKMEQKISRIRDLSAPQLIRMFWEVLAALEAQKIQEGLLSRTAYSSYSFSCQLPGQSHRVGFVWAEEPNLTSFFHIMSACQQVIKRKLCKTLYLIRGEWSGTPKNKGYKLYRQVFKGSPHRHLTPDLKSVHYLATYHSLVNSACSRELVVGDRTPNLEELEVLIRNSGLLNACLLLQDLGIVSNQIDPRTVETSSGDRGELDRAQVKEFILSLIKTQQFMGRAILIQNASGQFEGLSNAKIEQLIEQLCQENKVKIIDPNASPEEQLVALVS